MSADPVHAAAAAAEPRLAAAWRALEMVIDPEVGLDIVTMGLVYDVAIVDDVAHVTHSLTSRGCPLEAVITQGIREAAGFVQGVTAVETHLVWEPAWHPGMIAPGA
jgi:metal-sulfur cluster biosynthetic enzyme